MKTKTEISCKNCKQEIENREGLGWVHTGEDEAFTCELYAEPETPRKPSGFALWDRKKEFTVLFCVECFNERFNASMMVELAERVDTLFAGGSGVHRCINCQKAVN